MSPKSCKKSGSHPGWQRGSHFSFVSSEWAGHVLPSYPRVTLATTSLRSGGPSRRRTSAAPRARTNFSVCKVLGREKGICWVQLHDHAQVAWIVCPTWPDFAQPCRDIETDTMRGLPGPKKEKRNPLGYKVKSGTFWRRPQKEPSHRK